MGKLKKRRTRPEHPNPLGVQRQQLSGANGVADSESLSAGKVGGAVKSLVDKLQTEERECACMMLAGLVGQPGATQQLIAVGAVRSIAPLMLDENMAIQQTAVGALRNLSTEGSEVCEEMIKQDVMTSLVALLPKIQEVMGSTPTSPTDDIREVALQAMHLLWNLCEASHVAVEIFSRQGLMQRMLPFLDASITGPDLAVAAAQCLYTVTEDNAEIASQAGHDRGEITSSLSGLISQFSSQTEYTYLLLTVLTTGLLYNLSINPPGLLSEVTPKVLEVIIGALDMDISQSVSEVTQAIGQQKSQNGNNEMSEAIESANGEDGGGDPVELEGVDMEKKNAQLEKVVSLLCDALSAQQVSLEILANLCCHGEYGGDEEWEDVSSNESIGDSDSMEAEAEMEEQTRDTGMSVEMVTLLASRNVLPKVLSKIEPPDDSLKESLSGPYGGRVLASLSAVQERALFCLSNLTEGMSQEALGGESSLQRVWSGLSLLITRQGSENVDLLEASLTALRAVTHKMSQANPAVFSEASMSDLSFLVTLGSGQESSDILAIIINILATIGQAVAKQQPPPAILKEIGGLLLNSVEHHPELWVKAEALDGIFDVFGEDHLDDVIREINLVPHLKRLAPALKTRVQRERNSLGEHLPIVMTAHSNLMRFIKYKSKVRKH